ncbi:cupin domain-containing protein [Rhodanobacter sp. DHG33]|uniref:cupin domain-containing protein n=1 Tax=Rhodanobacter sp. DHG33 TaxID=2775921 RepID=UPI0017824202|nr:cupin domain-containing protein [Rhodanobacter sp. DHG33]MBD8900594.1 cupin domain-containing protein [Rhodanobacter sp. DHG33]
MNRRVLLGMVIAILVVMNPGVGIAQSKPAKPTVVFQRVAVPQTNRELGFGLAEFPPNTSKPHQMAKGPEVCYVLQGEVTVRIDGREPTTYRVGETWQMPAGVVHQTTAGPHGAKVLASWVDTPGQHFNTITPVSH